MQPRSGGEILVASLVAQGVTHLFGVPGESYLPVLDALVDVRDRLAYIVCRQEGGAATMAEAAGKLTGRPGVAIVTRGPGATNASIGVHVARQDSTPLVLLVGQVGSDMVDREAFQEVDYRRMFGALAKWVAQVDRAERIPEYVAQAWSVAMSGRPGPVVLALPEDMLAARASVADAPRVEPLPAAADAAQVAQVRALLARARAPLLLAGGSRWDDDACRALARVAQRWSLPIACAFRRQDLFDARDAHYAGELGIGANPALARRVREADVLVVVGERLGEMTTAGYTLLDSPVPRQALVHVHPGPEEIGRVYRPTVGICATPGAFLTAMLAGDGPPGHLPWADSAASAHADYEAWRKPRPVPGRVDLWSIVRWLDERLPDDTLLANGAGNYTSWLHRLYRYRRPGTQLAPYAGAMGYGVPASVAGKLLRPGAPVVSWNGDGCFLMNGQELATAVQYGLAIVFVVIDNGMYGTIRMHQERHYPGRVSGTDLRNPDFAALARAYGASGETIESTADFAPAFERALAHQGPTLLHVKVDPQALTMNASLDAIRDAATHAR
ncbi:MAG TPA: thiamine pyrophosphate-binding protein [Casimicrobiaceae bacterium]|nr:thiamine pyrophosphate-binding protein [Casimicrobiaceae bacterium]